MNVSEFIRETIRKVSLATNSTSREITSSFDWQQLMRMLSRDPALESLPPGGGFGPSQRDLVKVSELTQQTVDEIQSYVSQFSMEDAIAPRRRKF